jgi:mannosyl-3-phosphoglycerate phosphatase
LRQWVIFTDLDGTLLDRNTYSFKAAMPALEAVKKEGIPLILCTSKTRSETLFWWRTLDLSDPFIIESGGAIVVPPGYFQSLPPQAEKAGDMFLIPLGARYGQILKGLQKLKDCTQNALRGFSDMTPEEVAKETELSLKFATLAKQREFDEPFKFLRDEEEYSGLLPGFVDKMSLRVTKADRFYHLHGVTDKGKATKMLLELLKEKWGEFRNIGIADNGQDLCFLQVVDIPVVIERLRGGFDPILRVNLPQARFVPIPGPMGWNEAVLSLLKEAQK